MATRSAGAGAGGASCGASTVFAGGGGACDTAARSGGGACEAETGSGGGACGGETGDGAEWGGGCGVPALPGSGGGIDDAPLAATCGDCFVGPWCARGMA